MPFRNACDRPQRRLSAIGTPSFDHRPGSNAMTSTEPIDDRLYIDPELVQFYDLENSGGPDFDYCVGLARQAASVLDLGCGTGQLAAAVAGPRLVVGVDPAGAMLDVARARPNGDKVEWVEADARSVRLGQRFDLIVLTGHAFQVFLTPEDTKAVLETIARHLAPRGRFIFDTRNPATEEWREWVPDRSRRQFQHPGLGLINAWNDVDHDAGRGLVTYRSFYEVAETGRLYQAESRIAFPKKEALAGMIIEAGLMVEAWLGTWRGEACGATSPEIIPVGRLRSSTD